MISGKITLAFFLINNFYQKYFYNFQTQLLENEQNYPNCFITDFGF